MNKYGLTNDINKIYALHVKYCQLRGIAPKPLEVFAKKLGRA